METPNPLKRPAPAAHTGQRPAARRRVQFIIDDEDMGDALPSTRPAPSAATRTPPTLATGAVQTRLVFRPAAAGASTVVVPSASLLGRGTSTVSTTTTLTTSSPSASKPMAVTSTMPSTAATRVAPTAGSASPKAPAAAEAPKPRPLLPQPTASARTATLDAHYTVSKAGIPDSKFDAHRRWLTVEPPPNQYRAAGVRGRGARGRGAARGRRTGGAAALSTQHVDADTGTETVQLYREDQLTFTVPRHYGLARWGMPPPAGDLRTRGDATHVPFTGTLTPEQTEVCRRVLVQFGVDPAQAAARLCQRPAHQAAPVRASIAVALASKAAGETVRPVPSSRATATKATMTTASPGSRLPSVATDHTADDRVTSSAAAERARMTRTPGASVKCPCGFGKTVCAIYIMCMAGVKAIFTVAQEDHMDKTEEEIRRFAPTARIGRVHRDRLDVGEGYDIVLAMVQTLLARRYEPSVFDRFGLWVADEMHHMAAPAFSQVGSTLRCYYTLGLTATPRRKDGLTPALFWTFGPMVANVRRVWDGVVCRMVRYAKGDQEEILMRNGQPNVSLMITRLATDPVRNYYVARAVVDCMVNPRPLPARRKVIVLSDRREQLVLLRELILDAMMRHLTGEDVVVAGAPLDRAASSTDAETTATTAADAVTSVARDLLAIDSESEVNRTLIVSLLPPAPMDPTGTAGLVGSQARPAPLPLPPGWAPRSATALVEPPSDPSSLPGATRPASLAGETDGDSAPSHGEPLFSIGYFVGGMKREAREQGKRCDVILATYAEAGEGMDIPQLDTVVMVSPRSDVEQATGRALRTHPAKNEPLFIYFVDDFSLFRNQGWIVQRYCAGEGYHVRWETIN